MNSAETTRTLVLWDVDRTLLNEGRLDPSRFRRALLEVTGRELGSMPQIGGRTDQWIAGQLLASVGLPASEDLISQIHAAMVRIAESDRTKIAEVGVVLPGVPEVLAALAERPTVTQSVVTGNLRPIAAIKVSAFGLDRYLNLDIGGYGGVSEHRAALVADAVDRANAAVGTKFTADAVVVVGDTTHDIRAALEHGARAIGVATGPDPAEDLIAAGAHAVLPGLADTTRALAAILPNSDRYRDFAYRG